MICPRCSSNNVQVNTFQEQQGSSTVTKFKFKASEKHHGLLWWLFIGWWWWIIDLMLWVCFFPLRLLAQCFHKKKYVGRGKSVGETRNHIGYKTVCTCQACGHQWTP